MFDIDHNLGSEIMGITPGNFRIKAMRVRNDFYNWMNNRCGLINQANPCRCAKKTKAFIDAGYVDPKNLKFNTNYKQKIYELAQKQANPIVHTMEDFHRSIFKQNPLQELPTPSISNQGNKKLFIENNPKKALKYYDMGIALLPNDYALLGTRGMCLFELGNEDEARRDWERCRILSETEKVQIDSIYLTDIKKLKGYSEMIQLIQK